MSKYLKMSRRIQLMQLIEEIVLKHVKVIRDEKPPEFIIRNQRDWENVVFTDLLRLKPVGEAKTTTIKFSHKTSKDNYANIVHMLSKVYSLLANNDTCTFRELYYQDVKIMQSQSTVDNAIRSICCLLEASPWELGVMATSKGLLAGPLIMTTDSDEVIRCDRVQGGVPVPQNIQSIRSFESSAKFLLIVEKDAIFQKLLGEGILERLKNSLLITGKGYPDINTRLLIHRLHTELHIPVFALVDADPFGIEIMCVYRFGSLSMAMLGELLATPSVRWLGVLPSEISTYALATMPLTIRDTNKIQNLASRPYVAANKCLQQQLDKLTALGKKAEIEGIAGLSLAYLTDSYLPSKIRKNKYI